MSWTLQKTFMVELFVVNGFYPAGSYMFKVNNRNTRTKCEICSKLTIKKPQYFTSCSSVSTVFFEQVMSAG